MLFGYYKGFSTFLCGPMDSYDDHSYAMRKIYQYYTIYVCNALSLNCKKSF